MTGGAKPTVEEAVRAALAEWDALPETFTRFNDWTSDSVRGLPGELCRYGREGEDEIIVIDRFRTEEEAEDARLDFERDDMVARIVAALLADRTALVSRIKELEGALSAMRQRSVQALGAGISRRDWHATEAAYNEVRDRTDELLRAAARVITEEGK